MFHAALTTQIFARLGLAPDPVAAQPAMHRFWAAMAQTSPPFQQVFHDLLGGGRAERLRASAIHAAFETAAWAEAIEDLRSFPSAPGLEASLAHPRAVAAPETLVIAEVEALWEAIDRADDWGPLESKIASIRAMGAFNAALGLLAGPTGRPGHRRLLG
jgi:hypothetical protein